MSTDSIHYEFPLNEFTRSCLKINYLYDFIDLSKAPESESSLRGLMSRTLELYALTARIEIKNDLIKELEKRSKKIESMKNASNIDQAALQSTLSKLNGALGELHDMNTGVLSEPLPHLIDTIKQRHSVPGGQFGFDIPAYKYWLSFNPPSCIDDIRDVIDRIHPIIRSIDTFLDLLRSSATPRQHVAKNGFFQNNNDLPCDMLIVSIEGNKCIFPEVSGSKTKAFIRFLEFTDINTKPQQTQNDILFSLTCCYF